MTLSIDQQNAAAAARARRKPLHNLPKAGNATDLTYMKRYARMVETGKVQRVRLEKRQGVYFVFEIDAQGKPLGAGVPASPFTISLWREVCPMLR